MDVRALFVVAIAAGVLVGGSVLGLRLRDDAASPAEAPTEAAPTATALAGSPEDTARRFADAWSRDDITALYDLLSAEAQAATSPEAFEAAYAGFSLETTQRSVTAEVLEASPTGASVSVALDTRYFATLTYEVDLSLVETDAGYQVAWAPSALHPSLRPGLQVVSDVRKPDRGAIYDRDGEPLAITRNVETMALNRAVIDDEAAVVAALLDLGYQQATIDEALASRLGLSQRVRVGAIPQDRLEEAVLLQRSTPGLLIYFEEHREHPLGPAAAHVIGYTRELTAEELEARAGQGYGIGDRVGASGLEASLDDVLGGAPGGELRVVDDAGNVAEVLATREFRDGADVHTTLDADVLRAVHERMDGRAGAAVVIDPRTNQIVAINSSPSFDPDAFEHGDSAATNAIFAAENEPLLNRATDGTYSAGSVFKLVTGAAGFVYGGVSTGQRFDCTALWTVVDPPRRNWEGAQGPLTVAGGLRRSCNPVFYQIGYDLHFSTDNGLSEMARLFGFGSRTGTVGLSDEEGLVPDAEWKQEALGEAWFAGDDVNLAIGQGALLITPLQLANAYSAFINNELRSPVILGDEVAESRGELPLTAEQHAHLLSGLKMVTAPGGTAAYAFANAGYPDFAGKSGTAEDTDQQQHVLFVAFSPADAPRAVAAVILDDGRSGSLEAGPIARDLVLAALAAE